MEDKQFGKNEENKITCLFCGKEPRERFFSGSCESYLECECEEYKEWLASRQSVKMAEALRDARREYFEALAEEKKAKRELEVATIQVKRAKKEFEKQQSISLSEKKRKENE